MNVNRISRARAVWNIAILMALLAAAFSRPMPAQALAPSNDDFSNPIAISTVPTTMTMDELTYNDATVALDDPQASCTGYPYLHSIWYSFTPVSYGNATIDTLGSTFDAVVAVWTGARGNLTEVGCDDDSAGASQAQVKVNMKPGVKYYIEVMQYRTSTPVQGTIDRPSSPLAPTDYMTLNIAYTQTPNVAPAGKYDDKSAYLTYTGTWSNTSNLKAFSSSYKLSKVVGNTASITFDGIQFKLYYTRNATNGNMDAFLDGSTTAFATINQYGLTAYQMVYTSPIFSDGVHSLKLRDSFRYVTIDAIEIIAPPDVTPPSQITDLAAVPAAPPYGKINLAWTAPGNDGTNGTAKSYDVRYARTPIIDDASFNAATQVTSGVPTPKPSGGAESMSVNLVPGVTYYFAVRALDETAPDTTPGQVSNSPSATAPFSALVSAGTYGDQHAAWMYTGTWLTVTAANATDFRYRYTTAAGNSATIVFNGSGFTFTYLVNSYGGIADIRVDGVSVGQINMKSLIAKWKQTFTVSGLTPGQHAVQIIHLSGTRTYVDGITITP